VLKVPIGFFADFHSPGAIASGILIRFGEILRG
jgi:hypothetical protein